MRRFAILALGLALWVQPGAQARQQAPGAARTALRPATLAVPRPVLAFVGTEPFTVNGRNFIRYKLTIANRARIPAEIFLPAPNLPPCGNNRNSSRTWVDIYNRNGTRIYGFCALGEPKNLGSIWFALPEGEDPPRVYVELHDRLTDRRYRSNIVLPRKPRPVRR